MRWATTSTDLIGLRLHSVQLHKLSLLCMLLMAYVTRMIYIYIWNTSPHTNNSLIIYIYIVPAGNKRNIVTRGRGDRFVAVRSTHKLVSHALLCTPAAAKANVRVDRQTSHFKLRVLDNGWHLMLGDRLYYTYLNFNRSWSCTMGTCTIFLIGRRNLWSWLIPSMSWWPQTSSWFKMPALDVFGDLAQKESANL